MRAGVRGSFHAGVPADVAYLAAARDPPRTSPFWALVLEVLNTTLGEAALGKSCSAYVCREDTVGPITIPSLGLEVMF